MRFIPVILFLCTSIVSAQVTPTVYYKFDETTGTNLNDEIGTVDITASNITVNQTGKIGKAVLLDDASTSHGTMSDVAELQMYNQDFSFYCWVYQDGSSASWRAILGGEDGCFVIGTYNSEFSFASNNVQGGVGSGVNISLNTWTFIGFTFNSTATTNNVNYYINGTKYTKSWNYDFGSGSSSNVLGGVTTGAGLWSGLIDEMGIVKGTILSDADMEALYNGGAGLAYPYDAPAGPDSYAPVFKLLFDNTDADSSGNNFAGGFTGTSSFDATVKVQGTHAYVGQSNGNWESDGPYTFADRTFTVVANVRRFSLYGGTHTLFCNKQNTGSTGIDLKWEEGNQRLVVRSSNGVTSNDAYSDNNSLDFEFYYHIAVVYRETGSVTMFINNVKQTLPDSVILTDWGNLTDTLAIGSCTDGVSSFWLGGYIDNFQFYDYALSTAQVDSLYTYRTTNFQLGNAGDGTPAEPGTYSPVPGRHVWPDKLGAHNIPSKTGLKVYFRAIGSVSFPVIVEHYGYTDHYKLAIKQKFAMPENVDVNDYVGTFKKCPTYNTNNYRFDIETNYFSVFKINATTGLISINTNSGIKVVQQDTIINLVIRTTDYAHDIYELDTAEIRIKENSYCKFVDLSKTSGGNGTRVDPYSDMDDFTITAGYGYFLKRGSKETGQVCVINKIFATENNPTVIAAYGVGNNPTFDGNFNTYPETAFWLGLSDGWSTWDYSEYVEFYDLTVRRYYAASFYTKTPSDHIGFYNLNIYNNYRLGTAAAAFVCYNDWPGFDWNISDSSKILDIHMINCDFDSLPSVTCSFCEISYFKGVMGSMENCTFNPMGITDNQNLVRFTQGRGLNVRHCIFDVGFTTITPSVRVVQMKVDNATFEDCQFYSGGVGLYVTNAAALGNEEQPDSLRVLNCAFTNQGYAAVRFMPTSVSNNHSVGNIFENNRVISASTAYGLYLVDTHNMIIRRNSFYNPTVPSSVSLAAVITFETATNMQIYYNTINGYMLQVYVGTDVQVYNNTINGDLIINSSSTTCRNNFYNIFNYTGTYSNNLYIGDKSSYFYNMAAGDFRLTGSAVDAINKGYNVGLTKDIVGKDVDNTPDIGAFEH